MRSLFKWFWVTLIAGLLGLANAANAAGVVTITNYNNWAVGTAAVRADGALFAWGQVGTSTTTPQWRLGQNQPVISVTPDGAYALDANGNVLDLSYSNGGVVAGLSPVQAVIVPPPLFTGMGTQRPSAAILRTGQVRAIMTVMGMSGVQTYVQGGFGLSGVSAVSVVPRESNMPNTSWFWGVGSDGNLYDAQSTYNPMLPGISNVATAVPGLSNVTGVANDGFGDAFVTRSDGTVWAWGPWITSNGAYNAPWGAPVAGTLSPVQVPGLTNISSLAAGAGRMGSATVYALTATGDVWAWGNDLYGQVGNNWNNTNGFVQFPVQVPGLSNVAKIVSGDSGTLALTADGAVWGWGGNYYGVLGDGTNIDRYAPVRVGGLSPLTGVVSLDISGGFWTGTQNVGSYAVAAKADGSVWAWGDNSAGQLGNGTLVSRNTPVQVLGEGGMGFLNVQPAILTPSKNGVPITSTPTYNFGNVPVGSPSAAQTMTFVNTGMVAWTGFSFLPSVGDFAQTNNCGTSLAPGASCTLNITFTPTRAGVSTVTSALNMGNSNLGGGPGITLTGTGVGAQAVMSSSLNFGIQKTGTTTTRAVTLTNAGSTSLTVGTPGVTGTGFTSGTTTCGTTLAGGASCTLNVNFAPAAASPYTGTLTFTGSSNPGGAPSMALSGTGAAVAATRGDFNADGMTDILWRDMTTGFNAIWLMNGSTLSSSALVYTVPPQWTVGGILDFNGDAKSDILWRDTLTGTNVLWSMNGTSLASGSVINSATTDWTIIRTADFNGDSQSDILWFNNVTRQTAVWLMNNAGQVISAGFAGSVAQGWSIAAVNDFDGDGKADILWRNPATGANTLWLMDGASMRSAVVVTALSSNWNIVGAGDFNGDGKADILWNDPLTGQTAVWLMNGNAISSSAFLPSVPGWTVAKVGDFNGDGKADIMWRNASGSNAIWFMNGTTVSSSAMMTSVLTNWTVIKK